MREFSTGDKALGLVKKVLVMGWSGVLNLAYQFDLFGGISIAIGYRGQHIEGK